MPDDLAVQEHIKAGLVFAIEQFPIVGQSLSAIMAVVLGVNDTWDMIKDKTEQLINQQFDTTIFNVMKANLEGIQNNLSEYILEVRNAPDDPLLLPQQMAIAQKYAIAQAAFHQFIPSYKLEGFNLLLLPLYAQMANLHLALHREGCLHGGAWGWTAQALQGHKASMARVIKDHEDYVELWYQKGLADRQNARYANAAQRFTAIYGFMREMTLSVLEYKECWPYFDPAHPRPAQPIFNYDRELYSNAFGHSGGKAVEPGDVPEERITKIKIWEHKVGDPDQSLIDTVQVWYGQQEGVKMGGHGVIPATDGPLHTPGRLHWNDPEFDLRQRGAIQQYAVNCFNNDMNHNTVHGLGFHFEDGTNASIGSFWPGQTISTPTPAGYYMSSITAIGRPPVHRYSAIQRDVVGAIFFGFKRETHTRKTIQVSADGKVQLHLTLFKVTSALAGDPEATVTVPPGYKILSGGGRVKFNEPFGNLLTASFPADRSLVLDRDPDHMSDVWLWPNTPSTWMVKAKSHNMYYSSNGYIHAWVIAIFDPSDDWDVAITSNASHAAQNPTATAVVKEGYTLVSGGAEAHWQGLGHLLVASYPDPEHGGQWVATSKDHIIVDASGTVRAYALGLKYKRGDMGLSTRIFTNQSLASQRPATEVAAGLGYSLVGGGAKVNFTLGNLLTASYPDFAKNTWKVAGKDHAVVDACTITAYAIGLRDYR